MFVDEFHFHQQRKLPLWERVGHPVDTLSVLVCLGWTQLRLFGEYNLKVYGALAFVSCLMVTKDEFVHHAVCSKYEQWLHSVLFILHPLCFLSAGIFWANSSSEFNFCEKLRIGSEAQMLQGQIIAIFFVLLYQILYWNVFRKSKSNHFQRR